MKKSNLVISIKSEKKKPRKNLHSYLIFEYLSELTYKISSTYVVSHNDIHIKSVVDFILNRIQLKSGGKQKCLLLSLLSNCSESTNQSHKL